MLKTFIVLTCWLSQITLLLLPMDNLCPLAVPPRWLAPPGIFSEILVFLKLCAPLIIPLCLVSGLVVNTPITLGMVPVSEVKSGSCLLLIYLLFRFRGAARGEFFYHLPLLLRILSAMSSASSFMEVSSSSGPPSFSLAPPSSVSSSEINDVLTKW